jgi:hypothetical protein
MLEALVVARLLGLCWFRSEAVLAHARAFFPRAESTAPGPLPGPLPADMAEHLACVLLEFAVVDEAHGEAALAHAWTEAQALGLTEPFEAVARRELKMTRRAFADLKRRAPLLLEQATARALAAL